MANYFLNRYAEMTGDAPERIEQFSLRQCLRVNTLKTSAEELRTRLRRRGVRLASVPFLPDAFFVEAPFSLGATEEYLLGLYYLQEAASQLPALALRNALRAAGRPLGTDRCAVLDMAAAPGSKTTQLAALMRNRGVLVALDADARRGRALANNLERCGVTNAFAYQKDALHAQDLKMRFDGVLLDAPCSGNFALEKGWLRKRTPSDPKSRARVQRRLVRAALSVLAPGGVLVYSTCSLEPEENEEVLTEALPAEARLVDTGLAIGDEGLVAFQRRTYRQDLHLARRLWPHRHGTQGFFVAAIRNG